MPFDPGILVGLGMAAMFVAAVVWAEIASRRKNRRARRMS